eukprot:gene29350-35429_t
MDERSYSSALASFNSLPASVALEELQRCCGSPSWAQQMCSRRPFQTLDSLLETANNMWWSLPREEWLKAFAAHPKIGDAKALKQKFSKSAWEGQEQSGANSADEATLQALATLNTEYDVRNGFIFLICATGKSAGEMLEALRVRLGNDTATELQIAAGEQAKITKLRIMKLLDSYSTGTEPMSKL